MVLIYRETKSDGSMFFVTSRELETAQTYDENFIRTLVELYLNGLPQIPALEPRLEEQVLAAHASFAYSALVQVAQTVVHRDLAIGENATGRQSIEIVHYFRHRAASMKTSLHARQDLRTTDLPVLVVQRFVLSKPIAANQIWISDLDETDDTFHFAGYLTVHFLIRAARAHFIEYLDRRAVGSNRILSCHLFSCVFLKRSHLIRFCATRINLVFLCRISYIELLH